MSINGAPRTKTRTPARALLGVPRTVVALGTVAALLYATCPTTAFAAAPALRPGQEVVLGTYFEIWPGVCQGVARPVVVITQRPVLGELIVQGGQAPHNAGGKCGPIPTGTTTVIYRAGAAAGDDTYAWEVRYQHARRAPMRLNGRQTLTGR